MAWRRSSMVVGRGRRSLALLLAGCLAAALVLALAPAAGVLAAPTAPSATASPVATSPATPSPKAIATATATAPPPSATSTPAVTPTATAVRTPTAAATPTAVAAATATSTAPSILPLPDLVVGGRYWSVSQGCGSQAPWQVELIVRNVGGAAAGAFRVLLTSGWSWGDPPVYLLATWDSKGLAAGAREVFSLDGVGSGGNYLVAIADADGQVAESNEGNNRWTAMLPVMTQEPPCTPTATATMGLSATPTATPSATARPYVTATTTATPMLPGLPLPWFDGGESGGLGWTMDSPWALVPSSAADPAHSGAYSWSDSPGGSYAANRNAYLHAPLLWVAPARGSGVTLSYRLSYHLESGYDYLYVDYRLDNGPWQRSATHNGSGGGYQRFSHWIPVPAGAGTLRVRFGFHSDGSIEYDGVHLDDVEVRVGSAATATLTPTLVRTGTPTRTPTPIWTGTPTRTPAPSPTPTPTPFPGADEQRIPLHAGWNWFSFAVVPAGIARQPVQTPYFANYWGAATLEGRPAPVGAVVEAHSPRGDLVGSYTVASEGYYGYMRVYGEDPTAHPPIPGLRAGETVAFKVGGRPVSTDHAVLWQQNPAPLQVNLDVAPAHQAIETPYFAHYWGTVFVDGAPAPIGALVEAFDPRGNLVGSFTVESAGYYGFMRVYGEDPTAHPPIPGVRAGEAVAFKVNGRLASAGPGALWQNDPTPQRVDLATVSSLPVAEVLRSLEGRYDYVLSQDGIYAVAPPYAGANSLDRLGPGQGYFIWMREPAELMLRGRRIPVATPRSLGHGWQWIGYLPAESRTLPGVLGSLQGDWDYLLGEHGTYAPPPALWFLNSLHSMNPGLGYMIRMVRPGTLVYGSGGAAPATPTTTPGPWSYPLTPTPAPTAASLPVPGAADQPLPGDEA